MPETQTRSANGTTKAVTQRSSKRRSHYDLLQVSQLVEEPVLKAAYRALARENHPDVNAESTAEERMRDLNEAYDVLSDSRRRALYDLGLNQREHQHGETDPEAEQQGVRRRTACWRCSDPLEGAFARYCGECHWIMCEVCRGCGCQHPTWKLRSSENIQQQRRSGILGWVVATLVTVGWVARTFGSVVSAGFGGGG